MEDHQRRGVIPIWILGPCTLSADSPVTQLAERCFAVAVALHLMFDVCFVLGVQMPIGSWGFSAWRRVTRPAVTPVV